MELGLGMSLNSRAFAWCLSKSPAPPKNKTEKELMELAVLLYCGRRNYSLLMLIPHQPEILTVEYLEVPKGLIDLILGLNQYSKIETMSDVIIGF